MSIDTCPLRAFIMKSIHSFIICIFATMYSCAVSVTDERLVSCCFCLLEALLPFGPSWFLLSAPVPSWSFPQLLGPTFLWPSCSSKSWFCLVRHSTFAARVYSCLLRAVVHGSSPLLLLVAIERVSTIQHFVWEVVIWLLLFSPFPTNDANWWCQKSLVSCTVLTCSRQDLRNINKEDLAESTSVTPAKYPPRVKLERISTTLKCQSWEKLHVPWLVRALEGFYSSVKLTFVSWWRRSFLVGKILINIRILRDLFLVEIPLIRVNHVMQGISLNWYLWRSSQATLDPSAVSPRWSLASSETSRWLHRDDC